MKLVCYTNFVDENQKQCGSQRRTLRHNRNDEHQDKPIRDDNALRKIREERF